MKLIDKDRDDDEGFIGAVLYGLCGWSNNLIRKAVLPSLLLVNKPGDERVTGINRTKKCFTRFENNEQICILAQGWCHNTQLALIKWLT